MIGYFKTYYHSLSRKLLISLVFFILALAMLWLIMDEVVLENEEDLDLYIFEIFRKYILNDKATSLMYNVTQFSSAPFIKIAYPVLIVALAVFKFYRRAFFAFITGAGGLLIIYGMKLFFERPRPLNPVLYAEKDFSFPSGHATFSFILYGMMAYFIWLTDLPKVWKYIAMTLLVSLSFVIGFSRIYLRVHYPSDVIGGFCLGYSWLFLMIYAFRKWFPIH